MLSQSLSLRLVAVGLLFSSLLSCNSGSSAGATSSASTTGVAASSFNPTTGTIGTLIVISGKNFSVQASENQVRFGGKLGVPATVEVATATTLLTRVPIGALSGPIYVSSPAGEVVTAESFQLIPTVNAFVPAAAAVGSLVEIQGSGFDSTIANNLVSIHGVAAPVLDGDGSRLVIAVPVGATSGTVLVSTPVTSISKGPFIVLPSITGFTPSFGLPSTPVTISGFNFRSNLSENQVFFNGVAASVVSADYFGITANAPAGLTTGPISVSTPDGTALGADFVLPQTPAITNFQPSSGVAGTTVNITGQNFLVAATSVKFNGIPAASIANVTTSSLDAVVPPGASTGPIEVSHPFASALSTSNFIVLLPPAVTGISSTLGKVGDTLRITGTNFDPTLSGNTVSFGGGVVANLVQGTTTTLDAIVPAGAVTGPVSVTTAAGTAVSASSFRVVYSRFYVAANQTENTLSIYQADPANGDLNPKSYFFTGAGSLPRTVAVNSSATFVYAALEGTSEIGVYSLSPAGMLAPVQTLAVASVGGLAIHPNDAYLYVSNPGANTLSVYSIAANGSLSFLATANTGPLPSRVTVHPSGSYVYVANTFNGVGGNSVSVFSIDGAGSLSFIERKGTGVGPTDFQVHPNGLFAYSVAGTDCAIRAHSIGASGKLTLVNTVGTGPLGSNPSALTLDLAGKYAFVVNQSTNSVLSYSIDPSTGALTILGVLTATGGQSPRAVVADFSGRIYIANQTTNDFSIFNVDQGTGLLTFVKTQKGRQGPAFLSRVDAPTPTVVTPLYAYVPNSSSAAQGNSVSAFRILSGGSLLPNGSPTSAGSGPIAVAADPQGQFVYAANLLAGAGTPFLSQYKIDSLNQGQLIPNGSVLGGGLGVAVGGAQCLKIEPSGRFLYVGNSGLASGDGAICAFAIDRSVGGFGNLLPILDPPLQVFATSSGVFSMDLSPAGDLLYVLSNSPQRRVHTYTIDPGSGAIAEVGIKNLNANAAQAQAIAIHPNGKFAYVADWSTTNRIVVFDMLANGVLNTSPGNTASGSQPIAFAFHPSGNFLYVANQASDSISTYSVNPTTGLLTRLDADPVAAGVQDAAAGDVPLGLSVNPAGNLLYVANSGNANPSPNSLMAFSIGANGIPVLAGALTLSTKGPAAFAIVSQTQ